MECGCAAAPTPKIAAEKSDNISSGKASSSLSSSAEAKAKGAQHQKSCHDNNLLVDRRPGTSILDEVKEIIELPSEPSKYLVDPHSLELDSQVIDEPRNFMTKICYMYRDNSFHSFEHASHAIQSAIKLLNRVVTPDSIDYSNMTYCQQPTSTLHQYTYGITSDPLTQFAVAFSALIHDVDHQGVPNAQLCKEQSPEAVHYQFKSVAEQNSVDIGWELLMEPCYTSLRSCGHGSREELERFWQLVVNSVMATDIVDKELGALRKKGWETAFALPDEAAAAAAQSQSSCGSADDINRKKWNELFFCECYKAYHDGRADKDPSVEWYKGELGFFDFYIISLAKKLKECGVLGVASDEYLNYAEANRREWEEKGESIVEDYLHRFADANGDAARSMVH